MNPAASAAQPKHPRLAELLGQIEEIDRQAHAIAGDLSRKQLLWRPGEAWGVGDCLEHLTLTAELYIPRMLAALDRVRADGAIGGTRPWSRTLLGRFILWGVRGRRKLPAPRVFRPPEQPRQDVLNAFLGTQQQVAELIRQADGLAISRMRLGTPVSSLVKLNAGEAFELLQDHALRHLEQARRVQAAEGFPD